MNPSVLRECVHAVVDALLEYASSSHAGNASTGGEEAKSGELSDTLGQVGRLPLNYSLRGMPRLGEADVVGGQNVAEPSQRLEELTKGEKR